MQAKKGDKVKVHYTGKLTEGIVFDSSEGAEPLEFELGTGQVIEGFDNGIMGMTIGEKKTVHIPVNEAYGPAEEENVIKIPRSEIPADMELEIGMVLNMHQDGSGQVMQVAVADFDDEAVVLDGNHPLAGKDLIFDIELVEITVL
jgi:FKBP-type peptidyl-prolyl cis-trans isomerase 2